MSAILSDLCPELVEKYPQDETFIELCKKIQVQKAIANEVMQHVQVEMHAPHPVTADNRKMILDCLDPKLPGWDVTLVIRFPLDALTTDRLLALADDLPDDKRAAKSYLHHSELDLDGNKLTITLPHGAELLHSMDFETVLSQMIEERTGEAVTVYLKENLALAPVPKPTGKPDEKSSRTPKGPKPSSLLPSKIAALFSDDPPAVLQGHTFHAKKITKIGGLEEGTRQCTVQGKVFYYDEAEKPRCTIITAGINDGTASICLKWLMRPNERRPKPFARGDFLVVKGQHKYDPYRREMVIEPTDVMQMTPKKRVDGAEMPRVELHLHTRQSAMDAVCDVKQVLGLAYSLGHKAIAITDHGVVQAFPEAMLTCKKIREKCPEFKVIYGCEVYYLPKTHSVAPTQGAEGRRSNFHIILLAKSQTGLKNLYRIISDSHTQYYHRGRGAGPRVPKALLDQYREGLLVGTACEAGELYQAVAAGAPEEKLAEIAGYYDFLEIQPTGNNAFMVRDGLVESEAVLRRHNRTILALGKRLGKPVVATGDVHFLNKEDSQYRAVLQAAQGYPDADRQAPLYYRTTEEMQKEFAYLGKQNAQDVVVRWPNEIAGMIDVDICPVPIDKLYTPSIEGSEALLEKSVWENAHARFGPDIPETVRARLQTELDGIIGAGYAVLYVIAQKLVAHSEQNGYQVGSRGSVGSSAVAHFAGISEVNPLPPYYLCPGCHHCEFVTDDNVTTGFDLPAKLCPHCNAALVADGHDIPFETFLGFGGNKVPDIDLNFSGEFQASAHKYTEALFGSENVFRAGTITGIAEKTASSYAYKYLAEHGRPTSDMEIRRLADGITGVKKTTGQHPGGMVVLPAGYDIHDFTPIQHPANDASKGTVTTHFEFDYLHDTLLKLDELGHVVPTLYRYLEEFTEIRINDVPMDDPKVFSLLTSTEALGVAPEDIDSETGTFGIPELGTPLVRQMLREAHPKSFGDLIQISGLSHGTGVWKGNAQDLIRSGQCTISEVIGTRDSIMLYLIRQGIEAEKAFKITERVRKGTASRAGFEAGDEALMKAHGVPDWYIESCKKIEYMFPKAHAVAYLIAAIRIMWFKIYHPKAFYAAYFTARNKGMEYETVMQGRHAVKRRMATLAANNQEESSAKDDDTLTALQVANESLCRDIVFLPVELGESRARQYIIEETGIRMPYLAIGGIGETAAMLLEERARPKETYASVEEVAQHIGGGASLATLLEEAGILTGLRPTSQISFFEEK